MRAAYADPPYIGQAHKHYADDPACAEVDHMELIERLGEYDAWALSLSSPSLQKVLALCPEGVRVGVWVKPFASFKKNVNPTYAWEPVIFWGGRLRGTEAPTLRDWVSAMPPVFASRHISAVAGEKPVEFCLWVFGMLGLQAGDELDDLYPGSGVVTQAWDLYQRSFGGML